MQMFTAVLPVEAKRTGTIHLYSACFCQGSNANTVVSEMPEPCGGTSHLLQPLIFVAAHPHTAG